MLMVLGSLRMGLPERRVAFGRPGCSACGSSNPDIFVLWIGGFGFESMVAEAKIY